MACKVTRAATSIWLIGGTAEDFKASKLPSRREVLKVLLNCHVVEELSLKDSINKTSSMLLQIWDMARIPTKSPIHVIEHVRKLHTEWQGLKKQINRKSVRDLKNQQTFQDSLDYIFDVAHRDAMALIRIEEDRLFLEAQREKGRRGTMGGIDRSLALKEGRVMKRKIAVENYAKKVKSAAAASLFAGTDGLDNNDSNTSDISSESEVGPTVSTLSKLKFRGTVDVVTPEVAAALVRTNTSHRKAAYIISAIASTGQLHQDVEELIISPSAIRRARIKHRELFTSEIKASFDPVVPLVLHWDGKIMDDFTGPGRERIDRLPVLVSGKNVVKLLAVPKLHDGTAVTISRAVVEIMDEWGLRNRIKGLCFDTTASNTGLKGGVCVRLETELGQELLNLACRHHVSEIMLEKVFSLHDVSQSPKLELFIHFKDIWPRIDKTSFSTAMKDESMSSIIAPWKDCVIEFAVNQLQKYQPRDDYGELLELSIIFLGGLPPRGVHVRYPGAMHRSRWMARAIYSLKMWLFCNQYESLQAESTGSRKTRGISYSDKLWKHLKDVCLFVTAIYIKYWFQSPLSTAAPRNDLALLCALSSYHNKKVAMAAITAFNRHLWYLSEVLVGFSFFDNEVTVEEKRLMVKALNESEGSEVPPNRIIPLPEPALTGLHDLVTKSTVRFFKILGLSEDFMQCDPSQWELNETYRRDQDIVQSIKVVNDLAERGVALIQEFNSSLTRNEEQKQFLLQVVEDHRNKFSEPTKTSVLERIRPVNVV